MKKLSHKCLMLIAPLFLVSSCVKGQQEAATQQGGQVLNELELPFNLPDDQIKPLRELLDDDFQKALVAKIGANKKWKRLTDQKKMAIGVVDLRDINNIKFARINGSEMMYAASLPKIAVLLAAVDALEKGEIEDSKEVQSDMKLMISKSDNQATTRMIDLVGFDKIESVLEDPRYALYDEEHGGGLWVGKRYAKTGPRYPDPIAGLSHGATASQVCRFYYMMVCGKLVTPERSKQMLDIMEDPALHHKFVNTLDRIAPNARLFRKSGSWKNFHSDSILVWGDATRRYILVALIEDPEGESIIRQLVEPIEQVLNGK